MLEEVELLVYDKYIKRMVVEKNGVKKISKEELEKLKLSPHERNFIMYIINKQKIKVTEEKITRADRSSYIRDNNYGNIQTYELQKIDQSVMSKIEYSLINDKVYEDYEKLDEYLETRFIPTYVLLKQRKNANGEVERFLSIRLHHLMALKLSEAELEHVMNYLKAKNIQVGGKGSTLDGEFENYDYITTYKESALPLRVPANVMLQKIELYKQNNDQKLREEIITDNMRLVPYVTYRYSIATGINKHELESYGYEGLILALENFDVSFCCAFSTYAIAYIRGCVLRGIQEILNDKRDRFYYDYVNAKNAVEKENGVTLSENPELVEDVIDLLVETGKIKENDDEKEYARMKITSLAIGNASLDDEETVEELLASGHLVDTHDYAEEVLNTISKEELEQMLDTLTPREAEVLRLRFGFYDNTPKTRVEIAKIFGLSYDIIRGIEERAIKKLRHPSKTRIIRNYYNDSETEKYGRYDGRHK